MILIVTFVIFGVVCSMQRWQRRVFVLYDDGDLTYSVDENVRSEMFCSFCSVFIIQHYIVEVRKTECFIGSDDQF